MINPSSKPTRNSAGEGAVQGTVLIVGHSDTACSQLRALLRVEGYTAEAFSWDDALLDAPLPGGPCCIIADAHAPIGRNAAGGFALIERLKNRGEPIPVIFISEDADVPLSVRAIKAGAIDFLPRPLDYGDLLNAVEDALEFDTERRLIARQRRVMAQRYEALTPRERQVMDGVVRGLMNKQIAWELGISEITVKLHRSSLMRKMELRSVPDLVRASMAIDVVERCSSTFAGDDRFPAA